MHMAATCKYVHDYGYKVYDTMLHHFLEGYTENGSLCGTLCAKLEVSLKRSISCIPSWRYVLLIMQNVLIITLLTFSR